MDTGAPQGNGRFTTTHWSVVLEAGKAGSAAADAALDRLCQTYWYPVYVFVRRKGHSHEDAQDLTQGFFARFLEHEYFGQADQSRGKFRTFILRSLENFLKNERTKAEAEKRGGGQQIISWEADEVEKRYLAESMDGETPDKLFEKKWAMTLLDKVKGQLGDEFCTSDKLELFEALRPSVWGEPTEDSFRQIGDKLGMTEGAVKAANHRMKERNRELLRAEVAHTVATAAEVDEELKYLAALFRP